MFHAVFSSDWHFDGLRNHYPQDHARRTMREVEKAYQYAIKKSIPYMIVAGDISDSYKMTPESLKALLELLIRHDDHVTTYYMTGNHDYADSTTTSLNIFESMVEFKMLKNFIVVKDLKQIKLDGVTLNFCPFPHTQLQKVKAPCLNIIHQDVAGAVGDNGRELKVKHDIEIDSDKDFTVSGHIHKHQYLKKRRLLYNGSLFQKTFGEELPKGFVDLKAKVVNGKLKVTWEFVENRPHFELRTIKVLDQKQFSDLEDDPNVRYRIYVSDDVVVPARLRQQYTNIDQLWSIKGKSLTKDFDVENLNSELKDLPKIDPLLGLKDFFKKNKKTKSDFLEAKQIVKQALSELGY
jgi:DNA repair exonuclease SbcCD nuclease subunit